MEVKLVVVGGKQAGMEIPVLGPKFLIGRGADCHVRPQSSLVSRKHCAICVAEGSVTIEDLGSTNSTLVNGEKVKRQELKDGDRIKVGVLELEVRLAASIEGKKKPKVRSVKEAAARTVASTPASEEDLDISGWLEEDGAEDAAFTPPESPTTSHDTTAGKHMVDTVNVPGVFGQKEKEKKPPAKAGGQHDRAAKSMSGNSRSAAEDMLKQMFSKKKP